MSATINVNHKVCECAHRVIGGPHADGCHGKPVPLPCPIQQSVTLKIAGRWLCDCRNRETSTHLPRCPRETISVTCTISGETWAGSEVAACRVHGGHPTDSAMDTLSRCMAACRARWALVKALVTGKFAHRDVGDAGPNTPEALLKQRDAVFTALADMVRHEDGLESAAQRAAVAMGADGDMTNSVRASHEFLAAYVERLIEQVGVLS